jgi:glucose/arabinose dehydrogenase
MARLSRTLVILSLLAAAACGGSEDDSAPPSSPPPSGSGDTVTGRERFAWTQAGSASDASVLQFAGYLDGNRRVLEGVVCSGGNAGTLECNAPLPSMTPGRHTLELAAFYETGGTVVEGPRSAPLQLQVAGITPSNESSSGKRVAAPEDGPVAASDGTMMYAGILGTDLLNPVDVAVDPSGRVFVAERAGTIRIFDRDGSSSSGDSVDSVESAPAEGSIVLSIALAPDFSESHFVYVLKIETAGSESRALLVRARELNGRFGQVAAIASAPFTGTDPAGVIRFGPDGALYVGLGSQAIAAEAVRVSRDGGTILRLLPDGRTPGDNPRRSPVYSSGHRDPRGFVWLRTGAFMEVESGQEADEINAVRSGGNYGWPSVDSRSGLAEASPATMVLPAGTLPSGMTTVNDRQSPLDGDLIVSSAGLDDLLRIRMTPDGSPTGEEPVRLLQGRFGAIGQVTATPDGALVFVTRNREAWGEGRDIVVWLEPE